MKGHIFVLLIGIMLGGLVALPLTAMASSWSLPFMAFVNGQVQEGQGEKPEHGETHQQMHEMMDTMHGEGTSQRMHDAMPDSEKMMEQCAAMMDMMKNMESMMGNGGTVNDMGPMMERGGMMGPSDLNP
jgi:hypothetical protein